MIPGLDRKISVNKEFRFNIRFSISLLWPIIILSLSYLVWESYWAQKVGYAFIKWHTHLAVYYYLWLMMMVVIYGWNKLFHLRQYANLQILCLSICLTLMLTEALLMTFGIGTTYTESLGGGYCSIRSTRGETYYRTRIPHSNFSFERPEFKYSRTVNSLGYSDREWAVRKMKNEKRILCLGDSWTEGVGATYDSTYVSILQSILRQEDTTYTVMNGGTSGDDPCVNYVNYRDRLVVFKPDIVIQTLSCNDLNTDIATKGGMERFQKDGTIKLPAAPWWEPVYALSYISRSLFHAMGYNELLLKVPFSKAQTDELNRKAIETFALYSGLAKKEGCILIVIVQFNYSGQDYDLSPIVNYLHTLDNVKIYDLKPYYLSGFSQSSDPMSYYWGQDLHHNAKGYALMARGVKTALDSFCIRRNMVSETDSAQNVKFRIK